MKKLLIAPITAAVMISAMAAPIVYDCDVSYAAEAEAAVKLSAPTGLTYDVISDGKVRLSWNKVSGADGYVVYRFKASTGEWVRLKSTYNNYLNISGIKSGSSYYYKVAALDKRSGSYYRGKFTDYIKVKCNFNTVPVSESGSLSADEQQRFLSDYYKTNLAVSGNNPMNAEKTQAFIANAQVNGGQVMLVDFYFKNGIKLTYGYCISYGRVAQIGNEPIADSTQRNNSSAFFVKEDFTNSYYIWVENNYGNTYECTINKAMSGGLVTRYKLSSLADAIFYINDEQIDYGSYSKIADTMKKCTGEDEIVYLK
ncbi:MAG: fibronectin type III domain-containing protein [Oscillospiraceae bacterium]|nr:fibronectin type III domain-containing protein [Oscillospiraceae bacterium]MDY2848223.1 fibronectin type III domain-containing protein [Oscillospiraceae bacterium]